jgi:hypothetical protein
MTVGSGQRHACCLSALAVVRGRWGNAAGRCWRMCAAAGVDVLSAEEVMMVAWVVDAQVGGPPPAGITCSTRLVQITALLNVRAVRSWPRLPSCLGMHWSALRQRVHRLLGTELQARGRLAAFTAGAWPGLPNLLASHHLQGLLRLDAGAAPGSNPQVHHRVTRAGAQLPSQTFDPTGIWRHVVMRTWSTI